MAYNGSNRNKSNHKNERRYKNERDKKCRTIVVLKIEIVGFV
jgi:hypothetical protein